MLARKGPRKGFLLATCLVAIVFGVALPARCDVLYTFTGIGVFSEWSFMYQSPTFVTSDTTVPASGLLSCTTFTGDSCVSVEFIPNSSGNDVIAFATLTGGFQETNFFYFALGDFAAFGSYSTEFFFDPANLTVESAPARTPEPSSVLLLGSGLVAVMGGLCRSLRSFSPTLITNSRS